MGVVYEAAEVHSDRLVAIKVLRWRFLSGRPSQSSSHPAQKEQFQREARTIAGLQHRNIVPVYTFGEHDGYSYYVMPLLDAVSLDWFIRRLRDRPEPIGPEEAHRPGAESKPGSSGSNPNSIAADGSGTAASQRKLSRDSWTSFARIGAQVGTALSYAHQQGILHNDIKPGNLLLDSTGLVVVADFGVGRLKGSDFSDIDDSLLGTLRYMAPERLYGRSDERSDVYSLGVTLYELVSQTPAYAAVERNQLVDLILAANFKPLKKLAPGLPTDLETIVLTAMAVRPEDRYATARELTHDLLRFANNQAISAHRPSVFTRAKRWWKGE